MKVRCLAPRPRGAAHHGLRLGALTMVAACAGTDVLAPVIDTPPDGIGTSLQELRLELAHQGQTQALAARTFAAHTTLALDAAPYGNDLVVHLTGLQANIEVAYGRSCVFSHLPGQAAAPPHIYFARTSRWATVPNWPSHARLHASVLSTADHGALFVGGDDGQTPRSDLDVIQGYDGTALTLALAPERHRASLALLGANRALLFGGEAAGAAASLVELLELTTLTPDTVTRYEDARLALLGAAVVALPDGRALVFAGRQGPTAQAPASAQILELGPSGDSASIHALRTQLRQARSGHTATRLFDDAASPILLAGGHGPDGVPVASSELYFPMRETMAGPAEFAATLEVPRTGHQAIALPGGSVLVLGGLDAMGQPVRAVELFTLGTGFAKVGELPATAGLRDHAAVRLPDGRVLVSGGRPSAEAAPVASAFILSHNLLDNTVALVATAPMQHARANHQLAVLCDGSVAATGGAAAGTPSERYNPTSTARR